MTTKKTKAAEPEPLFGFVRSLLSSDDPDDEIVDRPVDAELLDRLGSVTATVAEKTAKKILRGSASPDEHALFLGAAREARECVKAKLAPKEAPGSSAVSGQVTVKIEHSGRATSDDFDEMIKREPDVAVST